jgi:hypothetical protein
VAGGESRKRSRRFEIAGVEICVVVLKELDERVGVAFRVPTGISGVPARGRAEQRWILDERLVCFLAAANPKRVGIFGVPRERTFAAVHFEAEAAFAAGADLRDAVKTAEVIFEMDKYTGVIIG